MIINLLSSSSLKEPRLRLDIVAHVLLSNLFDGICRAAHASNCLNYWFSFRKRTLRVFFKANESIC